MLRARLSPPWLICDMGRSRRVLSWALNRPGYCDSRHILWRKVDDADLPVERDVRAWLEGELAAAGHDLPTGTASGTGTDCIAVAAEPGDTAFAGLHTVIGEAAGAATLAAVRRGVKRWLADHALRLRARNDSLERRPG